MQIGKILLSALMCLGTTVQADDGDVVVNPPGRGLLRVQGEVGIGQSDGIFISKCESDEQFVLARESCKSLPGAFAMNQDHALPEGIYKLNYHNSRIQGVRITNGQSTTIQLSKIQIPRTDGQKFRVFQDLTNTDEMKKALIGKWSNGEASDLQFRNLACSRPSYADVCQALQTSPDAINNVVGMADDEANLYEIYLYHDGRERDWRLIGRRFVNSTSPTGGFVSVFPGAYGIQFTDDIGGFDDQYGIIVK
jgi:hypothetical protein